MGLRKLTHQVLTNLYEYVRTRGGSLTRLTCAPYEDNNLIRHRGDRLQYICPFGYVISMTEIEQCCVSSFTKYAIHCVVVVVLTLARIIKPVVTGQAPVTVELKEYPREKHK